jgi:hypothetical protein
LSARSNSAAQIAGVANPYNDKWASSKGHRLGHKAEGLSPQDKANRVVKRVAFTVFAKDVPDLPNHSMCCSFGYINKNLELIWSRPCFINEQGAGGQPFIDWNPVVLENRAITRAELPATIGTVPKSRATAVRDYEDNPTGVATFGANRPIRPTDALQSQECVLLAQIGEAIHNKHVRPFSRTPHDP